MFLWFKGDPLSHVRAHVDDGVLSASIDTKEDTYVIEVRSTKCGKISLTTHAYWLFSKTHNTIRVRLSSGDRTENYWKKKLRKLRNVLLGPLTHYDFIAIIQ